MRRSMPVLAAAIGAALLSGAVPRLAGGQPAGEDPLVEAGRRFDQGVAFVAEGRFEAALAEFLRAYEISGEWAVLYNLGQVSVSLGRNADAHDYFHRYLADGAGDVDPMRRSEVEGLLEEIEPRIARIAVEAEIDGALVLVDGVERGRTPLEGPVVVEPGSHVVEVRDERLAGGRERREVILASGLVETFAVAAAPPSAPPPVTPPGGEPPPVVEEEDSVWTSWWLWTIVGVVVAGGAATAAVLLWPEDTAYTDGSLGTHTLGVISW